MTYFRLTLDPTFPDPWFIGNPRDELGNELDCWAFSKGMKFEHPGPITIPVEQRGVITDLTLAAFGYWYATQKAAEVIAARCRDTVQLVRGVATDGTTLFVINPLLVLDCLDRRCVESFFPNDFPNKDKAGKPRMIASLSIHQSKLDGFHLFLVRDWTVAVVASQVLVQDLDSHDFKGFSVVPVRTVA